MAKDTGQNRWIFTVIVGLAAWAIPGAGHFIIKERKRAIVIFLTITLTFLTGLYIGSIGVIDPVGGRIWFFGQIMTSPSVGIIGNITETSVTETGEKTYTSLGHPGAIGQIYTSTAGLLNLLCILSSVYMAYSGRGLLIGEDEEDA